MNWSTVKPTDIRSIHLRLEGEVNTQWKVILKDGTVMGFDGVESGPHYMNGPKASYSLWDDNQDLYNWLCDLQSKISIPVWDPEEEAVDCDITLSTEENRLIGTLSDIVVQHNDDGDWTRTTKCSEQPSFYLD